MIVDTIVESVKEHLKTRKKEQPLQDLKEALHSQKQDRPRDFRSALEASDCAIIAEIKRSSPSAGRILELFDPSSRAATYEKAGAAALSVLTEENYFEGSLSYLTMARRVTAIPILRKDFIVDPYQIYEARVAGADAVLLIAGILESSRLTEFLALTRSLGMEALVEVHDKDELEKALSVDADIIGINNRDLKTFTVDLGTSERLSALIPAEKCLVAESGIRTRKDIRRLQAAGISAFLVGESLSRSADPARTLASLSDREGEP